MKDENWPVEWLRHLKDDVEHLTIMIYATKKEIKSLVLKSARDDLEDVLKWNEAEVISSQIIITWIEQIREKLEHAGRLLDLAAKIVGKNESSTQMAAKRAHRLAGRISSTIGLIKKALNKPEDCL